VSNSVLFTYENIKLSNHFKWLGRQDSNLRMAESTQAFSAGFAVAIGASAVLSFLGAVAGMWQLAQREVALVPIKAKA
jgi:hypothetical protein